MRLTGVSVGGCVCVCWPRFSGSDRKPFSRGHVIVPFLVLSHFVTFVWLLCLSASYYLHLSSSSLPSRSHAICSCRFLLALIISPLLEAETPLNSPLIRTSIFRWRIWRCMLADSSPTADFAPSPTPLHLQPPASEVLDTLRENGEAKRGVLLESRST